MDFIMDGEQATKKLRIFLGGANKLSTSDTFQALGGSLQLDWRGFYRVCVQVRTIADQNREYPKRKRGKPVISVSTKKRRYIRWKVYVHGHCEELGEYQICSTCQGYHYVQSTENGQMKKCPSCDGDGFVPYI